MVAYSFYEFDGRVMRYAEALVNRGDHVDVIALRHNGEPNFKSVRSVNVYKIQERAFNETNSFTYLLRLLKFFWKSTIILTRQHLKNKYDLIHIHTIPDFEVFCGLIAKITGAKIILDIHDLVPELYANKFEIIEDSFIFKVLVALEKISTSFADHIIISNHIWENKLRLRDGLKRNSSTFINYVDPNIFYQRQRINRKVFTAIYPGSLNFHQGLDIAIRAISLVRNQLDNFRFYVYGDGSQKKYLMELITKLNLDDIVFLEDIKPIHDIAEIMATADLGIVPKRNDSFGGDAFSTKILEFMSSGVPVIVSRTRIDSFYFNENVVKFFEPEDEKDLSESIIQLVKNADLRNRLINNALTFSANFSWGVKKKDYFSLVDSLVGGKTLTYT
jgi:glycosyltransferase involved in cell wall biosynthesis